MYTAYFGFKEIPFSIAPNPHFLFMGERHKEALAHLSYGLGDTGGFVLLTGEVGTGKTTLSRRLMEQLPENTQVAFILNPTLSSQELLACICDELKIRYRKTGATLKSLSDKIYEKLQKNHQAGINTLLIIDEAQHLKPEVLEQLRLLTNLETHTKKLLQVILIGQPELKQLLQRRDLRQLAQRITARYHLMPLGNPAVNAYIKHRLSVAQCEREIFNSSAITAIHQISQGIPRLINLLCDRALTNAYCSNNAIIGKKIIVQSAQEALGDEYQVKRWWQNPLLKGMAASAIIASVFFGAYTLGQYSFGQKHIEQLNDEELTVQDVEKAPLELTQPEVIVTEIKKEEVENNESSEEIKQTAAVNSNAASNTNKKEEDTQLIDESKSTSDDTKVVEDLNNKAFSVTAEEGVSEDLLAKFQDAIADTETDSTSTPSSSNQTLHNADIDASKLPTLADMPTWVQNGVPTLAFDMHIYASDGEGWVRVNGRDRYEGDAIAPELILRKILPQAVVLTYQGERFTMPALSSW